MPWTISRVSSNSGGTGTARNTPRLRFFKLSKTITSAEKSMLLGVRALCVRSQVDIGQADRRRSTKRTNHVKEAILATVISVKKQSSDSVAVRLESDELNDATVIVSTGLDLRTNSHQTPRVPLRCELQG
jgi:hypothetical protein